MSRRFVGNMMYAALAAFIILDTFFEPTFILNGLFDVVGAVFIMIALAIIIERTNVTDDIMNGKTPMSGNTFAMWIMVIMVVGNLAALLWGLFLHHVQSEEYVATSLMAFPMNVVAIALCTRMAARSFWFRKKFGDSTVKTINSDKQEGEVQ